MSLSVKVSIEINALRCSVFDFIRRIDSMDNEHSHQAALPSQ